MVRAQSPAQGNSKRRTQGEPEKPGESSSATKASLIDESLLVGLPLNGRSYTQLVTLEAGVSDTSAASASRGTTGGNLTVSGGRSYSNSFLLDGTVIMDTGNRAPRSAAGVQLGSDAALQVQIFATNYGAEYGRGSGGVLNSITRSGSNEFHGSLFEYFRNSKLDARSFFDLTSSPPPFKRNQFGFTFAGPLRKGKTYFMGSYEALLDRLSDTQIDNFPDAEARRGIITDVSGREIRRVEVSPRVGPYLQVYPLPNSVRIGDGFAQNASPQFLPTDESFYSVRIDHQISHRDSLFGRYTFDDATSDRAGGVFAFGTLVKSRQQYLTLVGSHIFSPSLLASARFGFTRPVDASSSITSLDIPRSLFFVAGAPNFGQINIPGAAPFGPAITLPEANVMNSFQYSGDVLAQREAHGLKFGAEVDRYRWDMFSSWNKGASWSFNSLDSFLEGGPQGTSLTLALPGSDNKKAYRQTLAGFYGQDEIKLRPNVQLSVGLRYEFATRVQDHFGKDSFLADPLRDTQVTIGGSLKHNPSLGNLSPRLGLSWSPGGSGNTVINSGFGVYYDEILGYAYDSQKNAMPFYRIATRTNFDSSRTFPDAVLASNEVGTPVQAVTLDYANITSPRVLRYEFSLQQRLPYEGRVQASYVGARGNHLLRNLEANLFPVPITLADGSLFFPPNAGPVNPAFQGGINVMSSDAQSFYNSFLLSAEARPVRGSSVRLTYTFSKSVDDASSIGTSASAQQFGPLRTLDRGLSDFDIRHRVSVNFFYNLPSAKGATGPVSRVVSQIVGGWRLGGIVGYRNGVATTARINVRRPGYLFAATRPNLLPGQDSNPTKGESIGCSAVEKGRKIGDATLFFDPCVFGVPDAGTIGNLGRNTLIGPAIFTADVSLQRELSLGRSRRLQFRAEFFNLTNHPNFRTPTSGSMVVFTGSGRFSSTVARYVNTATTSRQIQFALRLSF